MAIEILTVEEVGALLRLSPNRVILLARRGKIPSSTIDGRLRFDAEAIEDWWRSRCQGTERGRVEIEEFTTEEGGKWLKWDGGWIGPTKDRLDDPHLLKRYAHKGSLVVRLQVGAGEGFLNVHSLRLKNGREWDAVNNWRYERKKSAATIRVGIPKKKMALPRKTKIGRKG